MNLKRKRQEEMSKKSRKSNKKKKIRLEDLEQLEIYKRLRKTWERNPKTQVVPNKKKLYNRSKTKVNLKKGEE